MLNIIKDNGLLLVLIVLPLAIVAHNLFGAALAGVNDESKFSKEVLKKGLTKGALVYLGILIYSGISFLLVDLKIELAGEIYTLVDAMYVIILAAVVRYSNQGINKLMKIMGYKIKEGEEVEVVPEKSTTDWSNVKLRNDNIGGN